MSTELRYRKQPWGLVKGFIERNFWSGIDDNFRRLGKLDLLLVCLHFSFLRFNLICQRRCDILVEVLKMYSVETVYVDHVSTVY